jgi:hypothetical protein
MNSPLSFFNGQKGHLLRQVLIAMAADIEIAGAVGVGRKRVAPDRIIADIAGGRFAD